MKRWILWVAVAIAVVLVGLWWQHRSGGSELDELADLEHAVEDLDDPRHPDEV